MAPTTLPALFPTALDRHGDHWTAHAGRFVVTCRTDPDGGYDVVDTAHANILGHAHTNRVRVFELRDATAVIAKVVRAEWLAAVQRAEDRQRRACGDAPLYVRPRAPRG